MKSSEELAQECLRLAGDEFVSAVAKLTQLIDQDRAEQREACDKKYKALALQAAKDVEHWGSYANDYFATRWGLKDDIAKYMRLATDFQSPINAGVEE